jgi:hypothetical protein
MNASPHNCVILTAIVVLIALGWLLVASLHPGGPPTTVESFKIGLLIGTMFGQTSLAAGWCALGPFALVRRLPLAAVWLAALTVALGINLVTDRSQPPDGLRILLVVGGAMCAQWLLVQLPIWWLVARYGLRIRLPDETRPPGQRSQQFGISQLLILTTIVAAVLGVGRFFLGGLTTDVVNTMDNGVTLFGFLAIASALISFPLMAAALLRQKTVVAVIAAVALVALATVLEVHLFELIVPGSFDPQNREVLSFMNVTQCAWILATLLLLRAGGYRLESRDEAPDR